MKGNIFIIVVIVTIIFGCESTNETQKLENFLSSFSHSIGNYKVVCFVPVHGCGSCIDPSLEYARSSNDKFLLVLSSIYKKSINYKIETYQITKPEIIIDDKNFGVANGFVSEIAPSFYFLENGRIVKKVDLASIPNKKSILKKVDNFLNQ